MDEKNASTALDNTVDDIQEARDDNGGDDAIKQSWFDKGNVRSEFPVSLDHESIKSARKSVREDLELRWVTNLSEKRKRFYLIRTLLEFESFDMKPTQEEVIHEDRQVPKPSVLDDLLCVSSTSMDVDPSSVKHSSCPTDPRLFLPPSVVRLSVVLLYVCPHTTMFVSPTCENCPEFFAKLPH